LATEARALLCARILPVDEGGGALGTRIVPEENERTGLDMALVEDLIRRASL